MPLLFGFVCIRLFCNFAGHKEVQGVHFIILKKENGTIIDLIDIEQAKIRVYL
jgi:hypothetical protein